MSSPGMKPENQLKVILLSFFSIGVLVVLITIVSFMTTNAVAGHHGTGGGDGHGDGGGHAKTESHSANTHETKADDHGDAKHSETASHDEKADEHASTDSATEEEHKAADEHATEHKTVEVEKEVKHEDGKEEAHAETVVETEKTDHAGNTEKHVIKVSGDAKEGAKVFMAKTCATCHAVSSLEGAKGAVGPKLDGLAETAKTRKEGMDAVAYIKESIEEPNAYVVEGFAPAMAPLRATMSDKEYEDLIAFLVTL